MPMPSGSGRQDDPMRVTIYAEHGADWPLWGPNGFLDEASLPLSDPTKLAIRAWLNAYDGRRSCVTAPGQADCDFSDRCPEPLEDPDRGFVPRCDPPGSFEVVGE